MFPQMETFVSRFPLPVQGNRSWRVGANNSNVTRASVQGYNSCNTTVSPFDFRYLQLIVRSDEKRRKRLKTFDVQLAVGRECYRARTVLRAVREFRRSGHD